MLPGTVIRLAPEFGDWEGILRLILSAFGYMQGVIDPPSSANRLTPQSLADKIHREAVFAIFEAQQPIACVFCEPRTDVLYVGKLAIAPSNQGKGLGRRLMQAAEAHARTLGYTQVELQTRVELLANHAFFAALGYVKSGENAHPGYARATSITMRKTLM